MPAQQPTHQQLLIMIGERIATGEIKNNSDDHDYNLNCSLWIEDGEQKQIITLDLKDGKLTPDPAEEFLKKYGLNEEINKKND